MGLYTENCFLEILISIKQDLYLEGFKYYHSAYRPAVTVLLASYHFVVRVLKEAA